MYIRKKKKKKHVCVRACACVCVCVCVVFFFFFLPYIVNLKVTQLLIGYTVWFSQSEVVLL